jgi:hypothetical protein
MYLNKCKLFIHTYSLSVGMTLASICVFIQTYRSRFAFFYADDFRAIANLGAPVVDIFSSVNGHFVPVPTLIYNGLLSLFGISSYVPFLLTSAFFNWILSFSVAIYCKRNKLFVGYVLTLPTLILIIPNSAHTIFWTSAAFNLLPLALLIYFTTVTSMSSRVIQTLLFTLVGIGFGGYGLILVLGVFFSNFIRRDKIPSLISILAIVPLVIFYALYSSPGGSQIEVLSYFSWFFDSMKLLLNLLIPGVLSGSWTGPVLILIALLGTALTLVDLKQIVQRKARNVVESDFTLIASLFVFSFLIWIARGGVEPLVASRYVVIFSTLVILSTIRGLQVLEFRMNLKGYQVAIQRYFLWILIATSLLRAPYWIQAPRDINYQSGINRSVVTKYFCSPKMETDWNATSKIDGLSLFEPSRNSMLWLSFKKDRCL